MVRLLATFLAIVATAGATSSVWAASPGEVKYTQDSLDVVKARVAENQAVLVDVRYLEEWNEGHVQRAILLPLHQIHPRTDVELLSKKLPKDKIIYTYCSAGLRSLKAGKIMAKLGYNVRPLKPGYEDLVKAGFRPESN